MNKEDKKRLEDIQEFLKAAFCVDGDCEVVNKHCESKTVVVSAPIFKLKDSARGEFLVIYGPAKEIVISE